MTFSHIQALNIVERYQHLIGTSMDRVGDLIITNILITPFEPAQRAAYFKEYNYFQEKDESLFVSGFDPEKVYVELVAELGAVKIYKMLDKYLRDSGQIEAYVDLLF